MSELDAVSAALFSAVCNGSADAVDDFLALHPALPVDVQNDKGDTPLIMAARRGDIDVVRALLKAGASVHTRNLKGSNPLIAVRAALARSPATHIQPSQRSSDPTACVQLTRSSAWPCAERDEGPHGHLQSLPRSRGRRQPDDRRQRHRTPHTRMTHARTTNDDDPLATALLTTSAPPVDCYVMAVQRQCVVSGHLAEPHLRVSAAHLVRRLRGQCGQVR